jgi:hypothetical protein
MFKLCGKEITVYIPRGYSYREVTVSCGTTSPHGWPYQCEDCAKANANVDWYAEAIEAGENWDDD